MKKKLKCILLIDDDHSVNFLNEVIIKRSDCTESVKVCTGGHQALEYLRGTGNKDYVLPDLIFLDINMPLMNGWEFLEEYRKLENHLKTQVIIVMLTTSLNPDDESRSRRIPEINDFVNKPITPQLLNNVLKKYFVNF